MGRLLDLILEHRLKPVDINRSDIVSVISDKASGKKDLSKAKMIMIGLAGLAIAAIHQTTGQDQQEGPPSSIQDSQAPMTFDSPIKNMGPLDDPATKDSSRGRPNLEKKAETNTPEFDVGVVQYRDIDPWQKLQLVDLISKKWNKGYHFASMVVNSSIEAGKKVNIDPTLVLAVIAKESSFNPNAVSSVGAEGLMQVWRRYHKDKFMSEGIPANAISSPKQNILIGAAILKEYLSMEKMDPEMALQRYNGNKKDPHKRYAIGVKGYHHEILSVIQIDTNDDYYFSQKQPQFSRNRF